MPDIVMVKIYCDESHDETTYGLAGWIARPEEWDKFTPAWEAMLVKHGVPAFHAVEIVEREHISDSRFKGWTFDQEKAIFTDAINILLDERYCEKLVAIGCSISIAKWQEWIESKDGVWALLFSRLLYLLIREMFDTIPISLMFDSKKEVRGIVNQH